jgi:hypothetical protein
MCSVKGLWCKLKPTARSVVGYFESLLLERLRHSCHAGGMKKPDKKAAEKAAPVKRKRSSDPDVNQLSQYLVRATTEEKVPVEVTGPSQSEISRVMAALGRRGGQIGGRRRAEGMTKTQRSKAASMAAKARWAKRHSA